MAGFKNLAKMISNATKEKTPEQEFLYYLNEAIGRLDKETSRPPSQSYKPSSMGGCLRNCYFQVVGAKPDVKLTTDPQLVGMGQSGTARHEHIQTAISQMQRLGYDVEWIDVGDYLKLHPMSGTIVKERKGMETKLYNEVFNISFMCDGIIKLNGRYYILEIKTEVSFKFQVRMQPEPDHKIQSYCYSLCLGIDSIMFLYENRDVCQKKTFLVHVTPENKEEVVHKIETCNSHIENETVPPKETDKCKYCQYTEECKKH